LTQERNTPKRLQALQTAPKPDARPMRLQQMECMSATLTHLGKAALQAKLPASATGLKAAVQ